MNNFFFSNHYESIGEKIQKKFKKEFSEYYEWRFDGFDQELVGNIIYYSLFYNSEFVADIFYESTVNLIAEIVEKLFEESL